MNRVAVPAAPSAGSRASTRVSPGASVRATVLDVWAVAVPAVSFVEITFLGRLLVSELLMLVLLPWLLRTPDRLRVPRWFLALWGGWFLSQIVTDLVVESAFADYSRGWAKILFTLINFAAILTLVSTPRRARLFAFGLAAGGILGYLIVPQTYIFAAADPWKWAFAVPVGFSLAAVLSGTNGARRRWLAVGAFAAFGALNLRLGFRSLGGVAILTAGYLLLQVLVGRRSPVRRPSMARAVVGLLFCLAAALAILRIYDAAAAGGLLGPDAHAKYLAESGSLGVLIGGRSEILASTQAIMDSPFLGHGSHAKDPTYGLILNQRLSSLGYQAFVIGGDVIPAHSYLLGSWVESGLMGGLFWLVALVLAVGLLATLYAVRLPISPLLVFSTTLLVWNILFSPYGNLQRLYGPYGIAICLLGLHELRSRESSSSPHRALRET